MQADEQRIAVRHLRNSADELILETASRRVRVPCKGIARVLGIHRSDLAMGDVKVIADDILWYAPRYGGRIERCGELNDSDRGVHSTSIDSPAVDPHARDEPPEVW